eukprot:gene745-8997_t
MEEENALLKANLQKLKQKILDTGSLLKIHEQSEQELNKKVEELHQMEEKMKSKDDECLKYKNSLSALETQLNSLKSHNLQLRALVNAKKNEPSEENVKQFEELKKEIVLLKQEVMAKKLEKSNLMNQLSMKSDEKKEDKMLIEQLKNKISKLKENEKNSNDGEMNSLMVQVEQYKRKFDFLEKERDSSIQDFSKMKVQNMNLEKKIESQKKEIKNYENENYQLKKEMKEMQEKINNQNDRVFEEKYNQLLKKQKMANSLISELQDLLQDDSFSQISDSHEQGTGFDVTDDSTSKRKVPPKTIIRAIKRKKIAESIPQTPPQENHIPEISEDFEIEKVAENKSPTPLPSPTISKVDNSSTQDNEEEDTFDPIGGFDDDDAMDAEIQSTLEGLDDDEEDEDEDVPEIEKMLNSFVNKKFDMKIANEKSKKFWKIYDANNQKKLINDLLFYFQENHNQNYYSNCIKMFSFIHINSTKDINVLKSLFEYLRNSIFQQKNEFIISLSITLSLLSRFEYLNNELFNLSNALKILCFDLLREKCQDSILILSKILQNNSNIIENPEDSILSLTIQTILKESQNEKLSFHRDEIELYQQIEENLNWKSNSLNVEELVSKMLDLVSEPKESINLESELLPDDDFELIKSVELISSLKGWKWAYKELLIGKFWKFIQKPKTQNDTRRNIIVLTLVGLLGKLGLEKGSHHENREEIVLLRRRLLIVLSETGQKSFSISTQIAAANSFVQLSLKYEYLKELFNWFEKVKENEIIVETLFPNKLKSVFNIFIDSNLFIRPNLKQK